MRWPPSRQGKTLYVGISSYYGPRRTEAAGDLAGCRRCDPPAAYSLIDRRIEDRPLAVPEGAGVGAIAFSPLARACSPASTSTARCRDDSRARIGNWVAGIRRPKRAAR